MLNSFLLPVSIVFYYEFHLGWLIFNILSDFILLMDIVTIFWSGIVTDNNVVFLNLKYVRNIYKGSWLLIDIISLLPFNYIPFILYSIPPEPSPSHVNYDVSNILLSISKVLSMIKILRMVKLLSILSKWKEVFIKLYKNNP